MNQSTEVAGLIERVIRAVASTHSRSPILSHEEARSAIAATLTEAPEPLVERVLLDECTADEIRQAVRDSLNAGWGQNVLARTLGINSAKLSEFMSGKRGPEPGIVEPLGYRWVLVRADAYVFREEMFEGHCAALSSITTTEPEKGE